MAETVKFVVTKEYDGMKAGRYLRTYCKLSARTLAVLKRTENGITANGELLRSVDAIHTDDVIIISFPSEVNCVEPVKGDVDVLFEDEYLLVVNKPSGMPVHPVKIHQTDTLANIVAYRYSELSSNFIFRAVNRLDRNTSGIVIIAKDRHTASLMQNTEVNKHYFAICHGIPQDSGTINEPIELRQDSKIVRTVSESGQSAVTHYKTVQRYSDSALVDLHLETGRTHQIRCHMSHIGYPLLGDDLYGGSLELIDRQALHCYSIEFVHPFTSERITLRCDLPQDMKHLIISLTAGDGNE